jgi:polysaccharide pyruvyl transferase WcaK-like protein
MDVHDCSVYPYVNDRPVEERAVPALEDWLAAFADAEFIVTDSFHGCVLAILMHKRFIAVGNCRRGMARLKSLLDMFGLDMRLVHGIDPEDDGEFFLSEPDWASVDAVLETERMKSVRFLEEGLHKS